MAIHEGSAIITMESSFSCDGLFLSIGQRMDAVVVRVDVLEEQINQAPEGTDFLTPEDVQPLFNEREVIFDV